MWETQTAIDALADYNKLKNGGWSADLERPFKIHVEGETIHECQYRLLKTVDKHLADWVKGSAKTATPQTRKPRKK